MEKIIPTTTDSHLQQDYGYEDIPKTTCQEFKHLIQCNRGEAISRMIIKHIQACEPCFNKVAISKAQ